MWIIKCPIVLFKVHSTASGDTSIEIVDKKKLSEVHVAMLFFVPFKKLIQVLLDVTIRPFVRLLVPVSLAISLMLLLGFSLPTSATNSDVLVAPERFLGVLRSGLKLSFSEAPYAFCKVVDHGFRVFFKPFNDFFGFVAGKKGSPQQQLDDRILKTCR